MLNGRPTNFMILFNHVAAQVSKLLQLAFHSLSYFCSKCSYISLAFFLKAAFDEFFDEISSFDEFAFLLFL